MPHTPKFTAAAPQTGLDRVVAQPGLLGNGAPRRALLTNAAALTADFRRSVDALRDAGVACSVLLSPEHGYWGSAQAAASEPDGRDQATRLPVLDTYGRSPAEIATLLSGHRIDEVIVDLPDLGVRFFTYLWSLFDTLVAAALAGTRVIVLDRPNPIAYLGSAGPGVAEDCTSFVGRVGVPLQHGSTIGSLALALNSTVVDARAGISADLSVIRMHGWDPTVDPVRAHGIHAIDGWVAPSPNVPSALTALLYPGTCLFEGTNLSEGRGTTRPFELIGAAWVDRPIAEDLNELALPGVRFQEARFVPTFSKGCGVLQRGVQVRVTDRDAIRPLEVGVALLRFFATSFPERFAWLRVEEPAGHWFIDHLWGSSVLRSGVASASFAELLAASPPPLVDAVPSPLYAAPPSLPAVALSCGEGRVARAGGV